MAEEPRARVRWEALVYFWDGGWIGVGRGGGVVAPHSHHAVQISIGLNGPVRFQHADGPWQEMTAGAVLPDVLHSFDGGDSDLVMLFVDPESHEGRWLRDSLRSAVSECPPERIADYLPALRAFQQERPAPDAAVRTIRGVVGALCAGPPPLTRMDDRIVRAMQVIAERDVARLKLDDVARTVFLSPSRFAHLFTEEMGLPFRRYLLWRKLSRAMVEFGRGSNLSNAAHAAGFSDSAHLTRSWHQMFGISPTVMMGNVRFYEIPAPFELAAR